MGNISIYEADQKLAVRTVSVSAPVLSIGENTNEFVTVEINGEKKQAILVYPLSGNSTVDYIDQLPGRAVDYNVTNTIDSDDIGKMINIDSASEVILTLPAGDASMIGKSTIFYKQNSGNFYIFANGLEIISDSSAGGAIQNTTGADAGFAMCELRWNGSRWIVCATQGSWETT